MLLVLPSLISRQVHKKKKKCTETSRDVSLTRETGEADTTDGDVVCNRAGW